MKDETKKNLITQKTKRIFCFQNLVQRFYNLQLKSKFIIITINSVVREGAQ